MNTYEIDITDRDNTGSQWDNKTYIVKAQDPTSVLKKAYKQADRDFKKSGGDFAQVESLKLLSVDAVL